MLSTRAHNFDVDLDYLHTYSVYRALQNPYDAEKNPNGIINFGTAVNGLMDDVWLKRFEQIDLYKAEKSHFRYYQFYGTNNFLQILSRFMTKYFKPWKSEIDVSNLIVFNGALLSLDILGCLFGDEKDVFLCPAPAYTSYFQACVQRWEIEIVIVPMKVVQSENENDCNVDFVLTLEDIERVFEDERAKGKKIRALILNNPQNPLGKIFDRQFVEDIMKFCQRNNLHLIVDEMYCLSVFDPEAEYTSVLSMNTVELIKPDMLHVIWGFSKDLCLTSYRTGVIHTLNEPLKLNLKTMSLFQAVSLPTMTILGNIMKDCEWFEQNFFRKNRDMMQQAYLNAKNSFSRMAIHTTCSSAGFFFLVDFRPFIVPLTSENCHELVKVFYNHKVYLTPSWEMRAPLGWFRMVYTVYSNEDFQTGFKRIIASLDQWKSMSKEKL